MTLVIYLKVEVSVKALVAFGASEPLDSSMHLDVLVQVRPLSEAISAVGEVADVGALIRVDTEVVKKVVPFAEPLVTAFVLTFEDLVVALGLGVFVGKDTEALGVGHVLLNLHRVQVEGFS